MPSRDAFVGRAEELDTLRAVVTRARNGVGGALVIRGEPGIGKTALLDITTGNISGATVIRSDGFEAELAMPYAALHRVGASLGDYADALPVRQRQALRVALGTEDGPPPDRFLVGLGMLGLFAAAGSQHPVVCVVDDAHWLDSESREVLAFVARRLQAESTALLFGSRDTEETRVQLAGIPSILLDGLDTQSAVKLLAASTSAPIDPYAAARIAAATGGNPLALLDLTRDLDANQLTQMSLSPRPAPIGSQLEAHYLDQVRKLPADVRSWLLLAAAEPSTHRALIGSAAAALGLSPDCGHEAERTRLVTVADTVAFRHPLVRSAVYGAAHAGDRRRAHAALGAAAATLGLVDLEAWHAAEAAEGIDGVVADRLEAAAERAARRGGLVSQARLLTRASELTPLGIRRDDRLLAAARAAADAGAAQLARDLLDRLDPDALDPVQRGRLIVARTELALFTADPLVVRGPADLLAAAELFHGRAPELEQAALMRSYELMSVTETLMRGTTPVELGLRIRSGAEVLDGPRSVVMRGVAAHILDPYRDAVPLMRAALIALADLDDTSITDYGYIGITLTTALFDKRAGADQLGRLADIARDNGALRTLDTVLWVRSLFELDHGDPAACGEFVQQVRELRRAIGYDAENVINAAYLAWTGTPRDHLELIASAVRDMGFGGVHTSATTAIAVRDIAEGRYQDAYITLKSVVDAPLFQVAYIRFADFVEAAVRSGQSDEAERIADRLTTMAEASGTPALHGLNHRCRALLATDDDAEQRYLDAIEFLGAAYTPTDLGRAHLLYGEWLRRMKRRRDAREHLRSAIEIFERVDAPAFAQRARTELAATGERTSERTIVAGVEMSPQEAAVARMAADGRTNAEIGATLFISTNTVDYHLRKVFAKLGVSSRRQLAERFPAEH